METISMSRKERRRLEALSRVQAGELTLVEASVLLGVGYRQMKRSWARYQQEGDSGLVHRSRGRPSNRRPDEAIKQRALALYQEHYHDYGPTLAAECLASEDGLTVAVSTLRRWLTAGGLWQRRRRRSVHRSRRPRRSHRGELLQMDGSFHDWFEGRRGWAVLMVLIDDATGEIFVRFYEKESWATAADVFRRYLERYGVPRGLYVDRHSIYRVDREPTDEELLEQREPETQFGRALRELDVELILARSPQAKGRVERMNGTLQDRLVKALRRAGVSDLDEANRFLETKFLSEFNARFTVAAAKPQDGHRPVSPGMDLALILSIQEPRVVANDWTIRWNNRVMQLPRETAQWINRGQAVTVCQQLDGKLRVFVGQREVSWSSSRLPSAPKRRERRLRSGPTGSIQGRKPAADHPWRGKRKAVTIMEGPVTPPPESRRPAPVRQAP